MFQINDDLSIYVTRGDAGVITVEAFVGDGDDASPYRFQPGDVLRLKVFGKKDCDNVVLQKDVGVTEEADSVDIALTEQDTRIGGTINKPLDYWYEVELNPDSDPQTIICYDEENGPKVFRLYPEGRELEGELPSPEDIPIVDSVLDMTSMRPIQNQAVAREIVKLQASSKYHDESITEFNERLQAIESALNITS